MACKKIAWIFSTNQLSAAREPESQILKKGGSDSSKTTTAAKFPEEVTVVELQSANGLSIV